MVTDPSKANHEIIQSVKLTSPSAKLTINLSKLNNNGRGQNQEGRRPSTGRDRTPSLVGLAQASTRWNSTVNSPVGSPKNSPRSSPVGSPKNSPRKSPNNLEVNANSNQDGVRDITPGRVRTLDNDTPRSAFFDIFGYIFPQSETPAQVDLGHKEIDSVIEEEFMSMGDSSTQLVHQINFLRRNFFLFNHIGDDQAHITEDHSEVRSCCGKWIEGAFVKKEVTPTFEGILNQFWKMTISEVLDGHSELLGDEALRRVASSIVFLGENLVDYKVNTIFFERLELIYNELINRKNSAFCKDYVDCYELVREGKESTQFPIRLAELKIFFDKISKNKRAYMAAHSYLVLCDEAKSDKERERYYLLALEALYDAEAFLECFKLMPEEKFKGSNAWISEHYDEVKGEVLNYKSMWAFAFMVNDIIRHGGTSRTISDESKLRKLKQYQISIQNREKEWRKKKALDLHHCIVGISCALFPSILDFNGLEFEEWIDKLLEVQ
jgi:hypothetical protein